MPHIKIRHTKGALFVILLPQGAGRKRGLYQNE